MTTEVFSRNIDVTQVKSVSLNQLGSASFSFAGGNDTEYTGISGSVSGTTVESYSVSANCRVYGYYKSQDSNNKFSFTDRFPFNADIYVSAGFAQPPQTVYVDVLFTLPPITISPASNLNFTAGSTITPVQFTASGTSAPYTFSATSLPNGLALSTSGLLFGTPTALGQHYTVIKVSDGNGDENSITIKISISSAAQGTPVFDVPAMNGAIGVSYSKTVTVTGTAVSLYNFYVDGLPPGLSYTRSANDGKLKITGTPTTIGTYPVSVTASTIETYPVYGSTTFNIVIVASVVTAVNDTFYLANRAPETELNVLGNDIGSGLVIHGYFNPTIGTVRVTDSQVFYTAADRDDAYTTNFTYQVKDSSGTISPYAKITIEVAGGSSYSYSINDANLAISKNTPRTITSADQENLLVDLFGVNTCRGHSGCPGIWYINSVGNPSHGTVSLVYKAPGDQFSDVTFKYTPTTDYTGSDSILFTVKDPNGIIRTAALNITVAVAGTLTITPVSDVTMFAWDIYDGPLFTVQGGIYPYRVCKITFSGVSLYVTPDKRLDEGVGPAGRVYTLDANEAPSSVSSPVDLYIGQFEAYTGHELGSNEIFAKQSGYAYAVLEIVDGNTTPGQTQSATATVKFIIYGEDGSAPDPSTDPGDPNNPAPVGTATIGGFLRLDTSKGDFAARKVYLYDYTTGDKVDETTSNGVTGEWSFENVVVGEYFVVGAAQSEDLSVPRDFDALGVITIAE